MIKGNTATVNEKRKSKALELFTEDKISCTDIARRFGLSTSSVCAMVRAGLGLRPGERLPLNRF